VFRDRVDAGQQLAATLGQRLRGPAAPPAGPAPPAGVGSERPVILGLPRGGVPVAAEVARELDADLDLLVVGKIGVPWQPELALGAVGEGGVRVLNRRIAAGCGLDDEEIEALADEVAAEVERKAQRWRPEQQPIDLAGRTVVLVDDGIATGATMRAAVTVIRARGAAALIVAVPVAAADALEELRPMVDEVIALLAPVALVGVGRWYTDFGQTTDEEVTALLRERRSPGPDRSSR